VQKYGLNSWVVVMQLWNSVVLCARACFGTKWCGTVSCQNMGCAIVCVVLRSGVKIGLGYGTIIMGCLGYKVEKYDVVWQSVVWGGMCGMVAYDVLLCGVLVCYRMYGVIIWVVLWDGFIIWVVLWYGKLRCNRPLVVKLFEIS